MKPIQGLSAPSNFLSDFDYDFSDAGERAALFFWHNGVGRGGLGSGRLLAPPPPPENHSCAVGCRGSISVAALRVLRYCMVLVLVSSYISVCPCCCSGMGRAGQGPSAWPLTFWGHGLFFQVICWHFCASVAYPWWGGIRPLGIKVFWDVFPEEGEVAHGPTHPTINKSLETLMFFFFFLISFCCGLWFCSPVVCMVSFVSWVGILYDSFS